MNDNVSFDHIAALETLCEGLLPLLIDRSPNRAQAVSLLREWAERDTSVGQEVALGNIAETMLKRLPSSE